MLTSWTLLTLIKVSVKNKGLLSSAGLEQTNKQTKENSAVSPGSGADNLKQLLLP
jgi:hypothetical protein